MLNELTQLPGGLLDKDAQHINEILPGPTLIHLEGQYKQPLFVCVLQHGNEKTGWLAMRELLRNYAGKLLPRSLSLFISNVEAAQYGVRRLGHQIDYNRIWPGGDSIGTDEHRLMRQVWEKMRIRGVFASIDIHNNTGCNPHYACINRLDNQFLNLARKFSDTVVYFTKPTGVQSLAFAQLCPSVTIECGKPGEDNGVQHARAYVESVLHLTKINNRRHKDADVQLFHTVATVKIPDHLSIGFGEEGHDINFIESLDQMNFIEHPAGTLFARVRQHDHSIIEAWQEDGQEVAQKYFSIKGGKLTTRKHLMPSMLTKDVRIIKQDCLCYLMERMPPDTYELY